MSIFQSSVLLTAFTSLWSEWWMTGVVRQAAGCQRGRGVGTGGERSPLACWYCAGNPASSPATWERTRKKKKCEHKSCQKWQRWQKSGEGFSEKEHLNKSGRLVEWHLSRGNVQSEPGRFLPLQAAGALPPWFSHVLCPTPGLPATQTEKEEVSL